MSRLLTLLSLVLLAGCDAADPVAPDQIGGETIAVPANQAFGITLQTIGPGEFTSPPRVTSTSVRFVAMEYPAAVVPAGVTQRFQFQALRPGRAVITFGHTITDLVVQDTIIVQ